MPISVKICGLSEPAGVEAAVLGGARFVGFVFFPPSPRAVTPERTRELALRVPAAIVKVGLSVDANDLLLAAMIEIGGIDMLQLHGRETPERVAQVRAKFGKPVMKALPVASRADVDAAKEYESVADYLMFDARPPKDATRPGGNAMPFDWTLLAGRAWSKPWFLAGGLDSSNLADAVRITGAKLVDVSSGVEDAPGRKSPAKIGAFLRVAAGL